MHCRIGTLVCVVVVGLGDSELTVAMAVAVVMATTQSTVFCCYEKLSWWNMTPEHPSECRHCSRPSLGYMVDAHIALLFEPTSASVCRCDP